MPRFSYQIGLALLLGMLASNGAHAQSTAPSSPAVAVVRAVRVIPLREGPVVEILSSKPLVPSVTLLDGPSRLVIDLPGANLAMTHKRVDFRSEEINGVRADQFQNNPPITRVVVDLVQPVGYTWDAAGNRLMVRIHASADAVAARAQPPSVPAFTRGEQPVAVPVSPGGNGAIMLAGSRIAGGSSVSAGADTAILRLGRGGEVRVCPGTTVSVTSSKNGRDLMLGMSTGALEAHYVLDASADSVLTPDFRILLAGPGEFHYAISADTRGNTCVRGLPGNTASVIVSELMGEGTYQVKPSEGVVFRQGRLAATEVSSSTACGCPPPAEPMLRASVPDAPTVSEANMPTNLRLAQPGDEVKPVPPPVSAGGLRTANVPPSQVTLSVNAPETAPLPPAKAGEVHVQVDAPFVFRASDPRPPAPTPTRDALTLAQAESPHRSTTLDVPPLPPAPAPPPASAETHHRGFFGKIGSFFAAMFR